MSVVIISRQRTRKINARLLRHIIAALLAELEIENAELGINLVSAKKMTAVNWQFLHHAGSTDVITFDHHDARAGIPLPAVRAYGVTRTALHGELFICVDDAVAQAKKFGVSWQSEITRYVIHGVLHLLGHDDQHTAARSTMKCEENRLLCRLAKEFPLTRLAR